MVYGRRVEQIEWGWRHGPGRGGAGSPLLLDLVDSDAMRITQMGQSESGAGSNLGGVPQSLSQKLETHKLNCYGRLQCRI